MKQKLLAWGDDFVIRNEQGDDVFLVDGKVLSWGDKLIIRDRGGRDVALIDQKMLSWGPTYEIFRNDRRIAVVKKHLFTFLHCRFSVDVPGPDDLEAEGDFLDHEYAFTRHGTPVATVSKQWLAIRDTYGIDIAPGEDEVLILASAVVIDMVCHDGKKRH